MSRSIGIISVRMDSSHLPEKPLARVCGSPMVKYVCFRSKMSQVLAEAYRDTCDKEICHYADSIGATEILAVDTHERATDRSAEAMEKIEAMAGEKPDAMAPLQEDP